MLPYKMTALVLALTLVLCACGAGQDADASRQQPSGGEPAGMEGERTFTDMMGREIVLAGPVQKAVALTAAECEVFFALGAEDRLAGRGEYCDYPAQALELPALQSGESINTEEILALQPDAVFMSDMGHTLEQVNALADAGLTVIVSESRGIAGVYEMIEMMGVALGLEAEAEALVATMQEGFAQITAATAQTEDKPTVYFEVSPLEYGLWTAGTDTFMDEVAALLGLENCFSDVSGWREISQEQVIERNPDYIISITMYDGVGPDPVEEIMGRSGWENLNAVAQGNVFLTDSDEISRPGPRLLQAAEGLFDRIYGAA